MTGHSQVSKPRFCSECGTQLLPDALFCHSCGASIGGRVAAEPKAAMSPMLRWAVPGAAIVAVLALTLLRGGSRAPAEAPAGATPLAGGPMRAPDISAMSPSERADRLFNHVMRLWSEGKQDSVAFFAPMALASFDAVEPLNAHLRYDMGLVALVSGDIERASAQSDAILAQHPTHLLGLSLAARVADARGDAAAARAAREKLVSAETSERARALPEYTDHDSDLRAAIDSARIR